MIQKAGSGAPLSPFGGTVVAPIESEAVIKGLAFAVSKRLTFAASTATLDIVIDPTTCTCDSLVFLPVKFEAYGAGPIFIDFYIDPTVTPATGTEIESINRNFTSSNTAGLVVTQAPTVTDVGTKSPTEFIVMSNGTAAVAAAGGDSKEDLIIVVDPTKKYMFRFANQDSSSAYGHISINWLEA